MTVHNHGIDPACQERKVGECLLKPGAVVLDLDRIAGMMEDPARYIIETLRKVSVSAAGTRNDIADQIEAQTKPARIPEPGMGAHVTARKPDGTRSEFVRVGSKHWSEIGNGSGWGWEDLVEPILIREGVE